MKKFLKESKGIVASDALIAILIISLFTGVIATLLYNIYIANTSLKRMGIANSYVIEILEYADELYYEDLTTSDALTQKFSWLNEENNPEQIPGLMWELKGSPENDYRVQIDLKKYEPEHEEDEVVYDLVRQITVNISYKVGRRTQNIEISRIKARENLTVPNEPDFSLLQIESDQTIYPVKFVNDHYVVCTKDDKDWYKLNLNNIAESERAKVIISEEELNVNDVVSEEYIIHEWIPRYAVNLDEEIVFLFSNTNSYVESYTDENNNSYDRLTEISDEEYTVDQAFAEDTGYWNEIVD